MITRLQASRTTIVLRNWEQYVPFKKIFTSYALCMKCEIFIYLYVFRLKNFRSKKKSVFGSWWERCRRRRKFYGAVCSDSFFFSHETAIQFALEPQRVKEPILWLFDFELFWTVFGTVRKTNKLEKQIVSKQTLFIKKIVFHFLLFWDRVSERPSRLREVHHLTSSPKCWWRGE